MNNIARMRTIKQAIFEIKSQDPYTALTEKGLRKLVRDGIISHINIGNKQLIDLNQLELLFVKSN